MSTAVKQTVWIKDYRLNGYPRLPNGRPAELDFEAYLAWLADYLHASGIPALPEEAPLIADLQRIAPDNAMRLVGEHAGDDVAECDQRPYYRYPASFELDSDLTLLQPVDPLGVILGDEQPHVDPQCLREFVAEDYAFARRYRREMDEFRKLWPEFRKRWNYTQESGGVWAEPVDAGWRVLLAAILRLIPEKGCRIELLRAFFEEYLAQDAGL
jgi:hypothetical protein